MTTINIRSQARKTKAPTKNYVVVALPCDDTMIRGLFRVTEEGKTDGYAVAICRGNMPHTCDCADFTFRREPRGETCKHIDAMLDRMAPEADEADAFADESRMELEALIEQQECDAEWQTAVDCPF